MNELKAQYRSRIQLFEDKANALSKKYGTYALVRVLLFFVLVATVVLVWSLVWWLGLIAAAVGIFIFYRFVLWHQAFKQQEQHFRKLVAINQNELRVLDFDFSMFQDGAVFLDTAHPYALDLDIFGSYSLYQYCNRTTTTIGARNLAITLLTIADEQLIQQRHEAIAYLSNELDWRQYFQAAGQDTLDDPQHIKLLQFWLDTPNFVLPNRWLQLARLLAPIWVLAAIGMSFYFTWQVAVLFLIPNFIVLRRTLQQVNETHQQTTLADKALSHYAKLIRQIEQKEFQAALLQEYAATFQQHQAAKAIRQLSYAISQLNVRYNIFAFFLNIGGLWDLHWVLRLEKWKAKHKNLLPLWFEQLAKFETLNSLATLHYNNPDWTFPSIDKSHQVVEATALGHPLIPTTKRVTNDFYCPTAGHIKLITGSNMAGKSTFLRTVGLNIVLASVGAPVCAKTLKLPLLNVYTSMRTQDALEESTSSFYAELKRLQFIIEAVEAGTPIFFLLDEILKGTNSMDRHTGSKALIKQLIASKGAGIIATHDLELGVLEAQYDGAIENLRMEVRIQEGALAFDYKLEKGVSKSFNATILMQQMGIRIEEE